MKQRLVYILCFLVQTSLSYGQLGGKQSFEFLNVPIGAKAAGLGGVMISSIDGGVNSFLANPSLLDTLHDHVVAWNHLGFYADVKYNSFAFAKEFNRVGMLAIGIQSMGYGEIQGMDETGALTNDFGANETAVVISHSHQLSVFKLGASIKYIHGVIDTYQSSAIAFDIGGSFIHPEGHLMVSILFKNLGFVLSDYSGTASTSLPTDLQVGVTFKPQHMPFRFSVTGYNLMDTNAAYYDASLSNNEQAPGTIDQVFRHINLGAELLLGPNFNVRMGYNQLIRKELRIEEKAGMVGISLGFMARIKAFELAYSLTSHHIDGPKSYFTLSSNLNRLLKKKSII